MPDPVGPEGYALNLRPVLPPGLWVFVCTFADSCCAPALIKGHLGFSVHVGVPGGHIGSPQPEPQSLHISLQGPCHLTGQRGCRGETEVWGWRPHPKPTTVFHGAGE